VKRRGTSVVFADVYALGAPYFPLRVEVVSQPLPPGSITDATFRELKITNRIQVSERQLVDQLGCPPDLMRQYLKARCAHPATSTEAAAGMGLCAEELAALILTSWMIERFRSPFRQAASILAELLDELYTATKPLKVMLCVLHQSRSQGGGGVEVKVSTGCGKIVVAPELQRYMTVYNATKLMAAVEEALESSPLRLPKAKRCIVRH